MSNSLLHHELSGRATEMKHATIATILLTLTLAAFAATDKAGGKGSLSTNQETNKRMGSGASTKSFVNSLSHSLTEIVVVFFSDLRGNVAPCGCPSNPLGGVARMATYVKAAQAKGANVLLLCAGDVLGGTGTEERWKGETALAALREMGCDALVPGEMEWAQGKDWMMEQAKRYPFLMVNGQIPNPNLPVVHREFRLSGQAKALRVAIVGVSDQIPNPKSQIPNPKSQIPNPKGRKTQDAGREFTFHVSRLVSEARKNADFVIALAHVGLDGATRLAKEVAGMDLIIVGHAPQTAMPRPLLVGKTLVIANGDKGKSIGELRLTVAPLSTNKVTNKRMGGTTRSRAESPSLLLPLPAASQETQQKRGRRHRPTKKRKNQGVKPPHSLIRYLIR